MEAMGEWSTSLSGMCTEEADFVNQLLAFYDQPCDGSSSETTTTVAAYHRQTYWTGSYCAVVPPEEENNIHENVMINTNMYLVGEETSECDVAGESILPLEKENNHDDNLLHPETFLTKKTDHQKIFNPPENSKKRSRTTSIDKNKRASKARRSQKSMEMSVKEKQTEKASGKRKQKKSTTCCLDGDSKSEDISSGGDDSNALLNLNGKTRASRGAATDPQSLYARKRRERINERLRILQNLVPNGTKVDISTMLEEAVQYVKFLQLQIKLLSSDDLWMYAPIAYNGMDIGLNMKLNALV